mgnify:FL=1
MGTITRGTKAGTGTTDFGTGTTILASEVNTDFNTIANVINGNLDNNNIAAGAGIVYSKLSLTGGIVNADVNSSAAIAGSKLAVGASTPNSTGVTASTGLTIAETETTVATASAITTRGGTVLLIANCPFTLDVDLAGQKARAYVRFRWYRDATEIYEIESLITIPSPSDAWVLPMPALPLVTTAPAAGTYEFALKAVVNTVDLGLGPYLGGVRLHTAATNQGGIRVIELA